VSNREISANLAVDPFEKKATLIPFIITTRNTIRGGLVTKEPSAAYRFDLK